MDRLLSPFRQNKLLNTLFLSNMFISFHYFLIYYINSSFLSLSFSEMQVSALYIIGSIADTIFLLNASRILNKIGSYRFTLYATSIEFLATVGLLVSHIPFLTACYFLIHIVTISLLAFNCDIFIESASTDESKTGSIRATYLTITNIVTVIAPSLVALLLTHNAYWRIYLLSSLFIIPFFFLIRTFRVQEEKPIQHIRIKQTILEYIRNRNLYNIWNVQFLLQLFYAFMGVYTPLYLSQAIGFSWQSIGIMFTIMLLPFVFIEVPVGEAEDDSYTEREFLIIGFVIMGLSTLFISFITVKSLLVWATVLFITRIGASLVEISSDTFFFKHTSDEKTDVISFYRITRPLSFIVAPVLATIALQFIPSQYLFLLIGATMIIGVRCAIGLMDDMKIS